MSQIKVELPIFYSKRTCPYCVRARMAILASGAPCILREVDLKNKPKSMLQASPKGTVPVLVLTDGQVIEESLDIMFWALQQGDPKRWMDSPLDDAVSESIIRSNDESFAEAFMRLKYKDKFSDSHLPEWQDHADGFVQLVEDRLTGETGDGLGGAKGFRLTDIAILPFLLQYAELDSGHKLDPARYPKTSAMVGVFRNLPLYQQAMKEYPVWQEGKEPELLAGG